MLPEKKNTLNKFYKKSRPERVQALLEAGLINEEEQAILLENLPLSEDVADSMIENQIGMYQIPYGLALNFLIDGKEYAVPMAVEEPSVIAAASSAAKLFGQHGGFQTTISNRLMTGQAILKDVPHPDEAKRIIEEKQEDLLALANAAHPSIVRRGGGARSLEVRIVAADEDAGIPRFLIVHFHVETLEAMGANIINTMMEAVLPLLEKLSDGEALMGILSNYATQCLATATCRIPASALAKDDLSGERVRDRIVAAWQAAHVDPYRAVTHNKGIMNGIDAVVLASGNDWRAIEAAAHAYAARDGQYRSLSRWTVAANGDLEGSLTLPMPIGAVGGSISFHPGAKMTHTLLHNPDAQTLESIILAVGLAQNFSAVRALVTEGIQRGHMGLHSRSLAISAGATGEEIEEVSARLKEAKNMNLALAREILAELRQNSW